MKRSKLFKEFSDITDEDVWLEKVESKLKELGYTGRYNQNFKKEDFAYWKTFKNEDGEAIYQIGLLFYDFRKYDAERGISIMFECMLNVDARTDLSVSDDISLEHFELMSEVFHKAMNSIGK